MPTRSSTLRTAWVALALALLPMTGCASRQMRQFDIVVERADALRDRAVRLELVGVNDSEQAKWERQVAAYWKAEFQTRINYLNNGFIYEIRFDADSDEATRTLQATDPIWSKWASYQARTLYITADNLGPAMSDHWQRVLPLDPKSWEADTKTIHLRLEPGEIVLLTNPLPPRSGN